MRAVPPARAFRAARFRRGRRARYHPGMAHPLNIKHLETFFWIVRLGTFAAAAERLHTTQSTVSARIQELELALGVIVFDRSHYRAKLTPKGRELVAYAEQVVAMTSEIMHRIGNPASLAGVVRLGVAEMVAVTWLPALTEAVRQRFPNITLDIEVDLMNALLDQLREGDLDLVLGPGPVVEPNIASHSLGVVKFQWMAGGSLAVPGGELTPKELAAMPLLTLSSDSHHFRHIERWFAEHGEEYRFVASCNSMGVVADLTRRGQGVSLLPAIAYPEAIADKTLRILKTRPDSMPVEFFALHLQGRFNPLADAIGALALQCSTFQGRSRRRSVERAG